MASRREHARVCKKLSALPDRVVLSGRPVLHAIAVRAYQGFKVSAAILRLVGIVAHVEQLRAAGIDLVVILPARIAQTQPAKRIIGDRRTPAAMLG